MSLAAIAVQVRTRAKLGGAVKVRNWMFRTWTVTDAHEQRYGARDTRMHLRLAHTFCLTTMEVSVSSATAPSQMRFQ